jgi:hypothetical protein
MDVGVRHLETEDGLTHLDAGDNAFDGTGDMSGEDVEARQFVVLKVKDVIYLATGDDEGVTLSHGVDIKEGVELVVLRAAVAGDVACGDLTENGHLFNGLKIILQN